MIVADAHGVNPTSACYHRNIALKFRLARLGEAHGMLTSRGSSDAA